MNGMLESARLQLVAKINYRHSVLIVIVELLAH